MRTETVTVRIGEAVGPVDWTHPTAADKPALWREAEQHPQSFLYNGRTILQICMYDGWPYWVPTPAIQFIGPLNSAEWAFFNSYGVHDDSIALAKRTAADEPDCQRPAEPHSGEHL